MTHPSLVAQGLVAFDGAPGNLNEILRAVRTHLGMEIGFISEFTGGRRVFRYVESADGSACIAVGASDPLEESYCHWIVKGKLPELIRDPADHPFTAMFAVTKSLPVGAHLSVPIRLRSGEVYGTFCCFSTQPDPTLTERDLATMRAFAQLAGTQIQRTLDDDCVRQRKLSSIKRVLHARDLEIVYQPVIRLDRPGVAFVEALSRFRPRPYRPPDEWFATAAEVDLGIELEMLALNMALEGSALLPDLCAVSINISPEAISSGGLHNALSCVPLERIILEITEHDAVQSYSSLLRVIEPLRARGMRVAIDDTGSGYSSFRHILQIKPDIIKLDMSLSRDIDKDPARRALASALIAFAREVCSDLVAEGVETPAELQSLRRLGINLVQGHIFARPGPPNLVTDAEGGDGYGRGALAREKVRSLH